MTRTRRILAASILVGLVSWTGITAQSQTAADSQAARLTKGKALFQGKGLCFSCHGKEGEGLLAPSTRLAGRELVHTKANVPDLIALIKSGVDSAHSSIGQPMPAKGGSRLSDAEVEAVAWYVMELQKVKKP